MVRRGRQRAHPGQNAIREHYALVPRKQVGNLSFVGLELCVCPGDGGVLLARLLQFQQPQRQAVHEQHHVRAPVFLWPLNGELVNR